MVNEQNSKNPQIIALQIEIVSEGGHNTDFAFVNAVESNTIHSLRNDGYNVQPVFNGRRGDIFFEIITTVNSAWAQKDIILADISALATIFGTIIPVAKHILNSHKKLSSQNSGPKPSIKITTEIDGMPISIEAPDLESADAALKLAKRFQADYPHIAAKVTHQSKAIVKGHITKNHPRRR